jgi:hypothetical protein
MLWYPIKGRRAPDALAKQLRSSKGRSPPCCLCRRGGWAAPARFVAGATSAWIGWPASGWLPPGDTLASFQRRTLGV